MKILIVDDSKPIAMIVKEILSNLKYDCDHAENGQLGLDKLKSGEKFDLVLLDWNMPVLDGPGLLKALIDQKVKAPPIIMMTTENAPDKIMTALKLGAVEYIMKPFTADVLASKIEMISAQMS